MCAATKNEFAGRRLAQIGSLSEGILRHYRRAFNLRTRMLSAGRVDTWALSRRLIRYYFWAANADGGREIFMIWRMYLIIAVACLSLVPASGAGAVEAQEGDTSSGLGIFLLIIIVIGYFLPTVIVWFRRHPSGVAIFLLNLLLGWTVVGWVVALVWACTNVVPKAEVLNQTRDPRRIDPDWIKRMSNPTIPRPNAGAAPAAATAAPARHRREVFERDGAWYCVVDGDVYGSWASRELALSGYLSRRTFRSDVTPPGTPGADA
jgi:hypothetical protein